ncbi:sigma-54-dependent Fis family transcriptional regulator [Desulfolithobacter dissulfuricans]|uniref:Sigma-54-dependent Fis family transcriptional regulator n=1 Tax=Desulfolithobacter dissulfuricans TaxID=2795293 RepID=A0A915U952_9BACT|nr:sigma-54 dependent transcriptional regulator [Desulfolithobacter dissulfuricans]BCO08015.1 sigma-54-dependent Fis family transcriptional regulator [Desulfolithobacter dissulfuricans]
MKNVIVADDDPTARKILLRMLQPDYQAAAFADGRDALDYFLENGADIIITDLKMPRLDGMELLRRVMEVNPEVIVFVVTGYAAVDTAVNAMKMGAHDYLAKPFNPEDVLVRLERALKEKNLERQCTSYRQKQDLEAQRNPIITNNSKMQQTMDLARRSARTDSTILIQGETGVGKELMVRQIHRWSPRNEHPLVPVNCSALAEGIMESELFGHEKGAFTGADSRRIGFFEMADKGTIFLDEIGTADNRFQVKLLRVLQDHIIYRVGSPKAIRIDARVIAATNQNLEQEAREGRFRSDLYYRLSVVTISIPPLRERMDDVPLLADHFLAKYRHINPTVEALTPESYDVLLGYDYPGNVRELENIIERAMIIETTEMLRPESLLIHQTGTAKGRPAIKRPGAAPDTFDMKEVEKKHILHVLAACEGKKIEAARMLGINKTTLWRKMKKYGIDNL